VVFKMSSYPSNAELAEMVRLLTKARMEHWLAEGLGTWRWWVPLAMLIVPWFVWYRYVDKKKLCEILLYGTIIIIGDITLDEIGFELSFWRYPVDVIPLFPRLTSIDYTAIPVIKMMIYQYSPTWKSFSWATIAMSTVFSFIAEPLIAKLGFYQVLKWNYIYSFFIYIVMCLGTRWVVKKILELSKRG